jgi:hypothetical protein
MSSGASATGSIVCLPQLMKRNSKQMIEKISDALSFTPGLSRVAGDECDLLNRFNGFRWQDSRNLLAENR